MPGIRGPKELTGVVLGTKKTLLAADQRSLKYPFLYPLAHVTIVRD